MSPRGLRSPTTREQTQGDLWKGDRGSSRGSKVHLCTELETCRRSKGQRHLCGVCRLDRGAIFFKFQDLCPNCGSFRRKANRMNVVCKEAHGPRLVAGGMSNCVAESINSKASCSTEKNFPRSESFVRQQKKRLSLLRSESS